MDPRELLDAVTLFLDRHEDALDAAHPRRALEACEGLHKGLCETLAPEVGRALDRLGEASLERALAGDARAREACLVGAVRKRVQEAEGVLMHLQLTLRKGSADGPALTAWQRRVAHESDQLRVALAGLRATMRAWAGAARPGEPREALRLARACLAAGQPAAAGTLVAAALDALGHADAAARRAAGSGDAALVWAAHDAAQRALDVHGMPVAPGA